MKPKTKNHPQNYIEYLEGLSLNSLKALRAKREKELSENERMLRKQRSFDEKKGELDCINREIDRREREAKRG